MKAWLLQEFAGLDGLRLAEDVPIPEPGAGEVRIRLTHASLNPADRFLAERLYPAKPALPHILGRDGCGIVDALGETVTSHRIGERVVILRGDTGITKRGTFAECVVVPSEEIAFAPPGWSDAEASSAALVYETAHQALTQWGTLEPTTVLITGASGGVGVASLHLAKAWGHRAVGLSRSKEKYPRLREEGFDLVLNSDGDDLRDQVKSFTEGRGVGLVIDTLGGSILPRALDTLAYGGCVSVIGMLAGPVPQFNTAKLLFKRLRLGGVQVGDYDPPQAQKAWFNITEALECISKKPVVDKVYSIEKLVEAFHHLARGPFGKVVLKLL